MSAQILFKSISQSLLTGVLVLVSAKASALTCTDKVEGVASGDEACLVIPQDKPRTQASAAVEARPETTNRLITRNELSGDALSLDNDLERQAITESLSGPMIASLPVAGAVANQVVGRNRFIEEFLKSGPASHGDLRVITAGHPDAK